jgi:hypothetical protein
VISAMCGSRTSTSIDMRLFDHENDRRGADQPTAASCTGSIWKILQAFS